MRKIVMTFFSLALVSALVSQEYQLSKPVVLIENNGFFQKKTKVTMDFRFEGTVLRYSLDGQEPNKNSSVYSKPITVKKSGLLKVKAFKEGFITSETVSYHLLKVNNRIPAAEISPSPKNPYAGIGANTLIDMNGGSMNFRDGQWLGYNEGPIQITLDLGKSRKIKEVVIGTLVSMGSWIFPPSLIQLQSSQDGTYFTEERMVIDDQLDSLANSEKFYYTIGFESKKFRYIRLFITPLEIIPDWHPGKGNPGWVFMDEIIIR